MEADSVDRDIVVPAATLAAVETALRKAGAGGVAFRALRAAGRTTGEGAAVELGTGSDPAETLGENLFWTRLDTLASRKGWGSVSHSTPHPGVGVIDSPDWADRGSGSPFSEGVFSGLLSSVASQEVAVVRIAAPEGVRFAYGAPDTIRALRVHMAELGDLDSALQAL